jgi:hypothetical protein
MLSKSLYTIICYKIVDKGGNGVMNIKVLSILAAVFMVANVFVGAGAVTKNSLSGNLQSPKMDEWYDCINGEMEPIDPVNATGFIEWERFFESGYDDTAHCIQKTTDGGYIVLGNGYGLKVLLIKMDVNGTIQWEKNFSKSWPDYGWYVLQTEDEGYLILAETTINAGRVWLIKTDKDGKMEWERILWHKQQSACRCIQPTRDGGYILAGYTAPANWLCFYDAWLLKIDSEGFEEWDRTFERPYYNWAFYVAQTSDDGFIITGLKCPDEVNYSDVWLIKTDVNGYMEWDKTYGNPKLAEQGKCVQQTTDGGYIVTGEIYEPSGNFLMKTDEKGNLIWAKPYGGKCVQQTSDGGYICTGSKKYMFRPFLMSEDLQLVKTNSHGKKEWSRIYGGPYNDVGNFVLQTEDGGYIVVGSKQFPMHYPVAQGDVWIIKTGERPKLDAVDEMSIAIQVNEQQNSQNDRSIQTLQSFQQRVAR